MRRLLATTFRVLTLRAPRRELRNLGPGALPFGLAVTLLAGIGRYWDDPGAHLLQHLGLVSVAIAASLAMLLWFLIRPITREPPGFSEVLTYVALTAPPALLYAVPVERWVDLATAQRANAWFLAVVASWRVVLLFRYLRVGLELGWGRTIVVALLPLAAIVAGLTYLNLERAVFQLMAGIRQAGTPADQAYFILMLLTGAASVAFWPLALAYGVMVVRTRREP